MLDLFAIGIIALATYYLSYVITRSSGMYGIFRRWREYTKESELFSCIQCLSIWVAFVLSIVWYFIPSVVIVIAIAGIVIALDNHIEKR